LKQEMVDKRLEDDKLNVSVAKLKTADIGNTHPSYAQRFALHTPVMEMVSIAKTLMSRAVTKNLDATEERARKLGTV
jgi:hypothetical protein